jgi:hypothetical protein
LIGFRGLYHNNDRAGENWTNLNYYFLGTLYLFSLKSFTYCYKNLKGTQ